MALYRRTLCRLVVMLTLISLGSLGAGTSLETAHSAIGAQMR
jgi:hypothetical protein